MNVWKYTADVDHFCTLRLVDHRRDAHLLQSENLRIGKPLTPPFPTIEVQYETDWKELSPSQRMLARKGELARPDFPSLYGIEVILQEGALRALEPLIKDSVQIIPLECEDDRLYLIHVVDVVDCLDVERSDIKRFESGKLLRVRHYELKNLELLSGKGIFKMAGLPLAFLTDTFKALVEEHDLKGLVWNPLP